MTDLVTSGMLGDRLGDSMARVTVVNPGADSVVDALESLGVDRSRVSVFGDEDTACSDYVLAFEQAFTPRWDYSMTSFSDAKLGVGRNQMAVEFAVVGIKGASTDGIVELAVSTEPSAGGDDMAVTLGEFKRNSGGHQNPRARLQWSNGEQSYVAWTEAAAEQSRHPDWLALLPTAIPQIPRP